MVQSGAVWIAITSSLPDGEIILHQMGAEEKALRKQQQQQQREHQREGERIRIRERGKASDLSGAQSGAKCVEGSEWHE